MPGISPLETRLSVTQTDLHDPLAAMVPGFVFWETVDTQSETLTETNQVRIQTQD